MSLPSLGERERESLSFRSHRGLNRGDFFISLFLSRLRCVRVNARVNRGAVRARCVNEMWPRRRTLQQNSHLRRDDRRDRKRGSQEGTESLARRRFQRILNATTLSSSVLIHRFFRSLLSSSSCFMPGRRRDRFSFAAVVVGVYMTGRLRARRDSHLSGYIRRKWGGPRA